MKPVKRRISKILHNDFGISHDELVDLIDFISHNDYEINNESIGNAISKKRKLDFQEVEIQKIQEIQEIQEEEIEQVATPAWTKPKTANKTYQKNKKK